ncbi:MAG: hypothetical protein RL721_2319 [Candidatus Eisenbacteria bacterium]
MTAVSVAVGSAPVDQFVVTFQFPPAALVQNTAAAWAAEGISVRAASTMSWRSVGRRTGAPR